MLLFCCFLGRVRAKQSAAKQQGLFDALTQCMNRGPSQKLRAFTDPSCTLINRADCTCLCD